MKKLVAAAAASTILALATGSAASAADAQQTRRHVRPPVVVVNGDSRDAVLYYPGWGRDPVWLVGVYPGLVYGGAASAPAGR